jgi:hypothetical protein
MREIAVPWNESRAVVELGLWSMLSNPAVVKIPLRNEGGQTTPSLSNRSQNEFAMSVDMLKTLSYEMQSPRLNSASIKPRPLVKPCIFRATYIGRGVSLSLGWRVVAVGFFL